MPTIVFSILFHRKFCFTEINMYIVKLLIYQYRICLFFNKKHLFWAVVLAPADEEVLLKLKCRGYV